MAIIDPCRGRSGSMGSGPPIARSRSTNRDTPALDADERAGRLRLPRRPLAVVIRELDAGSRRPRQPISAAGRDGEHPADLAAERGARNAVVAHLRQPAVSRRVAREPARPGSRDRELQSEDVAIGPRDAGRGGHRHVHPHATERPAKIGRLAVPARRRPRRVREHQLGAPRASRALRPGSPAPPAIGRRRSIRRGAGS